MFRRRWLAVTVILVLWGLATHGTHAGEGDEPHYLAIAHSVARDFDFNVANNYGPAEPLIGGGNLDPTSHTRVGAGGIVRPVHDVGLPLLFSPFPRVGLPLVSWLSRNLSDETMRRLRVEPPTLYKHFVSAVMILVTAWLAIQLFEAFSVAGHGGREAFRWALLIVLSPPLLVMSISFFTEVVSALLCLVVFRRLMQQTPLGWGQWVLCGAIIGLLFLVHARNAGLVAGLLVLGVSVLRRHPSRTNLAAFATGFVVLFAVRTAITNRFWGTWLTTPHARAGEWTGIGPLASEIGRRGGGLLFDQEFGLLFYAPIFLLVPFGLLALYRTDRRLLAGLTLVVGSYLVLVLLPITNPHGWTGGWSPAARFWVPVVPLLALAVAAAVRNTPRTVLVPLVVLQIAINAYMWQNPKSAWNDADGTAAVCARTGAAFCRYLPSFVIAQEHQRRAQ